MHRVRVRVQKFRAVVVMPVWPSQEGAPDSNPQLQVRWSLIARVEA